MKLKSQRGHPVADRSGRCHDPVPLKERWVRPRARFIRLAAAWLLLGFAAAIIGFVLLTASPARSGVLLADPVTSVTVTLSDLKAGVASQYTIALTTSVTGALSLGGGQIIIQFPLGTTIPTSMSASTITVTTTDTAATKALAVAPTIDVSTRTVTLTTPLVIANSDAITVVFSTSAGLKNSITPGSYGTTASSKPLIIKTSVDTADASPSAAYNIGAYVTFSPTTGAKRGGTVTVTGGGMAPSTTGSITVGSSTTVQGTAIIDSSGNFSGSFIAGEGTKGGGRVAVTDGAGTLVSSDGAGCGVTCIAAATTLYVQNASASPRQTSVAPGSTVEVDLFDFTFNSGNLIADNSTTLAGTTVSNSPSSSFALSSGASAQFQPYKFVVALGTAAGTKNIVVSESGGGGSKTATFQLTVTAPVAGTLTLTPNNAVAGQTVTLSGTGFSPVSISGGGGANGVHQITGQGTSVVTLAGVALSTPNITYPVNLDSSGNFIVSVDLPVSTTTLTAATVLVKATDSGGRTGTASLLISTRTITLVPTSGVRGSDVEITGSGFAADNNSVSITYTGTQVANVLPDSDGDFKVKITVPVTATIPSANTVTATVIGLVASASATHTIPNASLTVGPTSGTPGSFLTVSGSNFPAFATVQAMSLGSLSILPLPAPVTDSAGKFIASARAPAAGLGTQSLLVTVGNVTSVTSFTITKPLFTTPTPTPTPLPPQSPVDGLAPLLAGDNLLRVWNFNNITKQWTFYDTRPSFVLANTITQLVTGTVYWINVPFDQVAILNSSERDLVAGWNVIAW